MGDGWLPQTCLDGNTVYKHISYCDRDLLWTDRGQVIGGIMALIFCCQWT